ncbi:MAG: hypothetical protein K8U03_17690 [Planctomycetia bacterium]|nr:hypothetical protein [Planctomycetia bacterium]
MRKHFAIGCVTAVALAWSLGMTGCCCERKGLVLRGDWSLEMNRVPHMRSNGPTYPSDACDAPCEDVSCTSCTTTGCSAIGDACIDGNCVGCRHGGRAGRSGGGGGGHGGYYEQVPGGGYEGNVPMPAVPQPTPAAQSRFHPVPTRPVFEPQRSVAYGPAEGGIGSHAQGSSGTQRAVEQRRAPPRPPEPATDPRGNRVALRGVSSSSEEVAAPARSAESEVVQAAAEAEAGASDYVAAEAALEPSESEVAESSRSSSGSAASTSALRVKTRRS